eukprot:1944674-Prymnesium_polylepis.1
MQYTYTYTDTTGIHASPGQPRTPVPRLYAFDCPTDAPPPRVHLPRPRLQQHPDTQRTDPSCHVPHREAT